jgi:8-oxo-dGTP pyrophosphatase MutT (NUDIX family)
MRSITRGPAPGGAEQQVSASVPVRGVEAGCTFPVSVKGVTVQARKVLLLENERAEWEPPDGKLELREDLADCVVREIGEEAGWKVAAGPLLDCWQYHIREGRDVVVVTYLRLPRHQHRSPRRQPRAQAGRVVRTRRYTGLGDAGRLQAVDRDLVRPAEQAGCLVKGCQDERTLRQGGASVVWSSRCCPSVSCEG